MNYVLAADNSGAACSSASTKASDTVSDEDGYSDYKA